MLLSSPRSCPHCSVSTPRDSSTASILNTSGFKNKSTELAIKEPAPSFFKKRSSHTLDMCFVKSSNDVSQEFFKASLVNDVIESSNNWTTAGSLADRSSH